MKLFIAFHFPHSNTICLPFDACELMAFSFCLSQTWMETNYFCDVGSISTWQPEIFKIQGSWTSLINIVSVNITSLCQKDMFVVIAMVLLHLWYQAPILLIKTQCIFIKSWQAHQRWVWDPLEREVLFCKLDLQLVCYDIWLTQNKINYFAKLLSGLGPNISITTSV